MSVHKKASVKPATVDLLSKSRYHDYIGHMILRNEHVRETNDVTSEGAPAYKMVFNRDPLGIASSVCVYILLLFGDYAIVYHVLEYGQHEGYGRVKTP